MKLKLSALLTISSFLFVGCSSTDSRISLVQNGSFEYCPQSTVKEMVDNFVDSPKWSALVADDNNDYVNVEGRIEYDNQPVDMLVQFSVDEKLGTFEMYYFGMNEVSQGIFMQALLIEEMCAASSK